LKETAIVSKFYNYEIAKVFRYCKIMQVIGACLS
jgi:hypothetical protein